MYTDFHFRYVEPTNEMAAVTMCGGRPVCVHVSMYVCMRVSAVADKTEINSIFTYCYRITDLI